VDFDADFEAGSLDEAYLDVTDYCQQHGVTGDLSSMHGPSFSGVRGSSLGSGCQAGKQRSLGLISCPAM